MPPPASASPLFINLAFEEQPNSADLTVFLLIKSTPPRGTLFYLLDHFSVRDKEKLDSKVIELRNFVRLYSFLKFSSLASTPVLQTDSSHVVQTKDLCLRFQE